MSDIETSSSDVTVRSTVRRTELRWTNWKSYIPTIITLVLSLYFIASLLLNGYVAPVIRRGFFCNDASIRYPHKPDTVDFKTLFFISLIIPAIAIKICDTRVRKLFQEYNSYPRGRDYLTTEKLTLTSEGDVYTNESEELLSGHCDNQTEEGLPINEGSSDRIDLISETNIDGKSRGEDPETLTDISLVSHDGHQDDGDNKSKSESYSGCQLFIFGYITTMFISGIGKVVVGRLRPHFWARCNPDTDCKLVSNMNTYVENFTCTNSQLRPRDLSYISTSWPSGHAAVMFYSMLFTIIYLHKAIPTLLIKSSYESQKKFNVLLPYAIYAFMTSLAVYVSLTRVSDYHHHPTDVLSGSVLGSIIALVLGSTKWTTTLRMTQRNDNEIIIKNKVTGDNDDNKCDG